MDDDLYLIQQSPNNRAGFVVFVEGFVANSSIKHFEAFCVAGMTGTKTFQFPFLMTKPVFLEVMPPTPLGCQSVTSGNLDFNSSIEEPEPMKSCFDSDQT
jgi:hypothetical protein